MKRENGWSASDARKADEARLDALRGGLTKQTACSAHFISNKVFRGDLKRLFRILKDYDDDIVAVHMDTVYFGSAWSEEWDIDENVKETFTLPNGKTKEIPR